VAPVAPIVHYVGPQIFANELHEPVALAVIECVIERLRCVGDLAQVSGLHDARVSSRLSRQLADQLCNASNTQNATTTTARRIIRIVLTTHLPWNFSL